MTDEPAQRNEPADDWVMPEPVFRTTEGRRPGEVNDPQADIPTEPGFFDLSDQPNSGQAVRARTGELKPCYVKKKRWCLRTFGMFVAIIGLSFFVIVVTLLYFLLYYRPVDTTF